MEAGKLMYILSVNRDIHVSGILSNGVFKVTIREAYESKNALETSIPLFGNVDTKPFEKWI